MPFPPIFPLTKRKYLFICKTIKLFMLKSLLCLFGLLLLLCCFINSWPIYVFKFKFKFGATIANDKGISFSSSNDLTKFYRASNSILRAANKPSEEVQMHLLYTCCIPILSYASAVKSYPSRQMQNCSTAVNDALWLIFGFNRWESVRSLRESFGYRSLVELFNSSKRKFENSLLSHRNPVIFHLARNVKFDNEKPWCSLFFFVFFFLT